MTDGINAIDDKNETQLSWQIKESMVYDEN